MRKSTIFISAVLTSFVLVILYRVAATYNDRKVAAQADTTAVPTSTPVPVETNPPAAPAPTDTVLGPVDAAQLAAKVVGNTNLLSAETSSYNGVNAYLITFANNDAVYVGIDGQILSVQVAPVTPVVVRVPAPTTKQNNGKKHTSNSSRGQEGGGEHEGHDD